LFGKIKNFIVDILFPVECLGCGLEGEWICTACLDNLTAQKNQICIGCGQASAGGCVCESCKKDWLLDGILLIFDYDNKVLQKAIKGLKYKHAHDIARCLSKVLFNFFSKQKISNKDILIIPVPLHKKRLRERGFNQAELLCQEFVKMGSPMARSGTLVRNKYTKPQAKLKEKARKKNIVDAFTCSDPKAIRDKTVILVDDVITTGSTLNECARVLKNAGAREVWGLALAKG